MKGENRQLSLQQNLFRISKLTNNPDGFLQEMGKRIVEMMKLLKPYKGIKRVKLLHQLIDEGIAIDLRSNPKTSCKSGCSNCCYMNVDIFDDEGIYLAQKVKNGQITYNEEEFQRQKNMDADDLFADPGPCIFLKDHKCSIYLDRPLNCRKYFVVVDDPVRCKIEPSIDKEVGTPSMINAEILVSAMDNVAPYRKNASLAHILDKGMKGELRK